MAATLLAGTIHAIPLTLARMGQAHAENRVTDSVAAQTAQLLLASLIALVKIFPNRGSRA